MECICNEGRRMSFLFEETKSIRKTIVFRNSFSFHLVNENCDPSWYWVDSWILWNSCKVEDTTVTVSFSSLKENWIEFIFVQSMLKRWANAGNICRIAKLAWKCFCCKTTWQRRVINKLDILKWKKTTKLTATKVRSIEFESERMLLRKLHHGFHQWWLSHTQTQCKNEELTQNEIDMFSIINHLNDVLALRYARVTCTRPSWDWRQKPMRSGEKRRDTEKRIRKQNEI